MTIDYDKRYKKFIEDTKNVWKASDCISNWLILSEQIINHPDLFRTQDVDIIRANVYHIIGLFDCMSGDISKLKTIIKDLQFLNNNEEITRQIKESIS